MQRLFQRVPACAEITVEPAEFADIEEIPWFGDPFDPTIRVWIAPETPHGTEIRLRADIESGRAVRHGELFVYRPEENPIVGHWTERAQLPCGPSFVRGDVDANGKLQIADANGRQELTDAIVILDYLFLGGRPPAQPFPECGTPPSPARFACDGYDICPPVDELDRDADVPSLEGFWLGTPPFETVVPACGNIFRR